MIRRAFGPMLVCGLWLTAAAEDPAPPVWREDFEQPLSGWSQRGRARTPDAVFQTVAEAAADNGFALSLTADRGTGTIGRNLPRVDLRRTPILRWRWRALQAPAGADGRRPDRDDQAIAIYLTTGNLLRQRGVAYRWESDTPVGVRERARYAGGIVQVEWFAMRNAADAGGGFFVEERDLAADFQSAFGFVPDELALGISINSQYTGSRAAAQLDWIEFAPRPSAAR